MFDHIISTFPYWGFILFLLVLCYKMFLFLRHRGKRDTLGNFFYYTRYDIITTREPKKEAAKGLQNKLTVLLGVYLMGYLILVLLMRH